MAAFPKKTETNSTPGEVFSLNKKSGTFGAKDDLKDVECYKCHKKEHYANKCPEIKAKDTKGPLKVRKMDEGITKDDADEVYSSNPSSIFWPRIEDQRPIYELLGNSI